jgi:Zn-dependent protease
MKWSWRIGQVAGIGIFVHGTFLLLLAWVAVSDLWQGQSLLHALAGILFILTLFAIVVLHELGHALTARRFGIRTRDITLLPIGGVARLERMPDDPRQELLVALAGPAVNFALAGLIFAALALAGTVVTVGEVALVGGSFVGRLFWVNVMLGAFNLLPAFPMDGGRVLRALLAMRMDYVAATQRAASVGQALALALGFVGLFSNPFLVFIALFVWIGAGEEAALAQMNSALRGIPIGAVMITDFRTLEPRDALTRAIAHIMAGSQEDFPVLDGGQVVGVLTRSDLLAALSRRGPDTVVEEVMQRRFDIADPGEMADGVLARLQEHACHSLPVVRAGRLVGVVTMENVGEFLSIQTALAVRERAAKAPPDARLASQRA